MSTPEQPADDPINAVFRRLGATTAQAQTCARQLRRRAAQKAAERGISEQEALAELLEQMARAAAASAEAPPWHAPTGREPA